MRNVIVTGIPRSGTTLVAALIDSLPDSVCLNEPAWQAGRRFESGSDYARWLVGDFMDLRQKLLAGTPVKDRRAKDHSALTNYFSPGFSEMQTHYAMVDFTRPGLTHDFMLAVKHNGPYLAILKPLLELGWFTAIAVVRHPVEVIHSWHSLKLPISRGEMPGATPYWPKLADIVAGTDDLLVKQVKIYDLMCRRIYNLRERIHVLPYETLVKTPAVLSEYLGVSTRPAARLIDKPKREIPAKERRAIMEALKTHGEYYSHFYPHIEDSSGLGK